MSILGHCEELLDAIGPADPRRKQVKAILTVATETLALSPQRVSQDQPAGPGHGSHGSAGTPTPSQTVLLVEDEGTAGLAAAGWLSGTGGG